MDLDEAAQFVVKELAKDGGLSVEALSKIKKLEGFYLTTDKAKSCGGMFQQNSYPDILNRISENIKKVKRKLDGHVVQISDWMAELEEKINSQKANAFLNNMEFPGWWLSLQVAGNPRYKMG